MGKPVKNLKPIKGKAAKQNRDTQLEAADKKPKTQTQGLVHQSASPAAAGTPTANNAAEPGKAPGKAATHSHQRPPKSAAHGRTSTRSSATTTTAAKQPKQQQKPSDKQNSPVIEKTPSAEKKDGPKASPQPTPQTQLQPNSGTLRPPKSAAIQQLTSPKEPVSQATKLPTPKASTTPATAATSQKYASLPPASPASATGVSTKWQDREKQKRNTGSNPLTNPTPQTKSIASPKANNNSTTTEQKDDNKIITLAEIQKAASAVQNLVRIKSHKEAITQSIVVINAYKVFLEKEGHTPEQDPNAHQAEKSYFAKLYITRAEAYILKASTIKAEPDRHFNSLLLASNDYFRAAFCNEDRGIPIKKGFIENFKEAASLKASRMANDEAQKKGLEQFNEAINELIKSHVNSKSMGCIIL